MCSLLAFIQIQISCAILLLIHTPSMYQRFALGLLDPLPFLVKIPVYSPKNELATLRNRVILVDGEPEKNVLACIKFNLTVPIQYFFTTINCLYVCLLLFVGASVIFALFFNPWTGNLDPFKAICNFSMDPDALRMTALGFTDFVLYLQFMVSTAMLTVAFPKFYINTMSLISWSTLLFRVFSFGELQQYTFVDYVDFFGKNGYSLSPIRTKFYGLYSFLDSVGVNIDCWVPFMVIWIIFLLACCCLAILIVGVRWMSSRIFKYTQIKMHYSIWKFTFGVILRFFIITYNPLVTYLSAQYVAPPHRSGIVPITLFAVLTIFFPAIVLLSMLHVSPRSDLYDNPAYLHMFGPLYNTYREEAIFFWVYHCFIQFLKGLVTGTAIASGTMQLILSVLIECTNLFAYVYWRPHYPQTNMNALNVFLSLVRLIVLFLIIPLSLRLKTPESIREMLTYAILFIHAIVCFIFMIFSTQRIVEVIARMLGARSESKGIALDRPFGWARVFGINELKRRRRPPSNPRLSLDTSSLVLSQKSMATSSPINTVTTGFASSYVSTPASDDYTGKTNSCIAGSSTALLLPNSADTPSSRGDNSPVYSYYRPPKQAFLNKRRMNSDRDRSLKMDILTFEQTSIFQNGVDYAVREADVYHPYLDANTAKAYHEAARALPLNTASSNATSYKKGLWKTIYDFGQSLLKLPRLKKRQEEIPAEKGFQVIRPCPQRNPQLSSTMTKEPQKPVPDLQFPPEIKKREKK
ncbi:Trp-like ion channel [Schizosaccharomyces japonicus yFS275]|uniref:Trp-like ion channel n=1 Tax=Schizosaccharomyces japonicus (strain yFS275 / FY16936) TaxID=402676 RepID=B6JXG3_SCHJY|nr:Trp-like ion channel [Schizosaccharomyces japonicus yFS275]EEB06064.2 Trp-like ion channel [Schizosaccharomyces japonicus yFS275]